MPQPRRLSALPRLEAVNADRRRSLLEACLSLLEALRHALPTDYIGVGGTNLLRGLRSIDVTLASAVPASAAARRPAIPQVAPLVQALRLRLCAIS